MIHTFKAGCLSLFFAATVSVSPALALDESDEEMYEPSVQEHVQVTATRTSQRDIDVAAAITSVDEAAMLESAPDVIAEMLRGQPGAFFQQTTPGQGVPIIRGLKGSQVLHMVDGMRLNNSLFRNAPNQYIGLVDVFSSERVELVRGAQGSLYGADAMGGVLNILTPVPDTSSNDWQQESRLYASYDSVDNGLVLSARTQGGKRGWGFSGGLSYQDRGDRKSGNGQTLSPSGFSSKAADLKFVMGVSDDADLTLSAQVMEQPSTPRYDELNPGFGEIEPASEQFLFEPNRREFIHARYRSTRGTAWYDEFEANLARQVIIDDRLSQDFGSPEIISENNSSTLDGMTLQFNSTIFSTRTLVWGAEFYTDSVKSRRYLEVEGSGIKSAVRSRFPDRSAMDSAALYLSGEWLQTDKLDLSAGLRYSWFDIRLPAGDNTESLKLSPSDLTGDIHAVFAIDPGFKLVANMGRGFRPPNIFDLATLGPRPGNRFNILNTQLGPETVWSYDFGFKKETDRLELEAFVFYLDYADKITSVFTGEVTDSGRDIIRSENRNSVQLYGLETGLYWEASDDLSLFAVVNYTHGEETDEDAQTIPADRIPPLNGKLGLTYFLNEDWRIEPYVLFAGEQNRLSPRDVRDSRIDPDGTDGWFTLNLLLDRQVNESLKLGLRLENLTNKTYREHASGIDAPGRNIGAWLEYRP